VGVHPTFAEPELLVTVRRLALISTGGTIEKTYDPFDGALQNRFSVLDAMLATLQLPNTQLVRVPLLNKDSLEMDAKDHRLIATTAHAMAEAHDGVIIVHGTDRLANTGDAIWELGANPPVPIVLTGAMRPYELRDTDAIQNVTEALLAAKFLPGGVYAVLHNEVHAFPGVRKDRQAGRFLSGD
jgi:L-asparaginase